MTETGTLRILAETAYPASVPSARVRIAGFAPFLEPHGVALEHRPTLDDADHALLRSSASAARKAALLIRSAVGAVRPGPPHDLLLVHRLRMMAPLPFTDPPRHLDVYDFDDALFLKSAPTSGRNPRWARYEASRCVRYLRRARLVLAGNAFLAERASEHARRVEVVPSCVDPDAQPLRRHAEHDVLTVGWVGSRTTSGYLAPVIEAVGRMQTARRAVRLVLVGADPAIRSPWVEHRPWSLETEASDLASFDIGVMPLPDTDWTRGKCGYKALQYFAAGVPAVASPVGVAAELIADGRGVAATSPGEWRRGLELLADDPAGRQERGAAARAFVESHYSYQAWAPRLAALLRSV